MMIGPCASGVFHVFFRNSLDFAHELLQIADKYEYINVTLCSHFRGVARRVCSGQAENIRAGRYILSSPEALGLEMWTDVTRVEYRPAVWQGTLLIAA